MIYSIDLVRLYVLMGGGFTMADFTGLMMRVGAYMIDHHPDMIEGTHFWDVHGKPGALIRDIGTKNPMPGVEQEAVVLLVKEWTTAQRKQREFNFAEK